MKKVFTTILIVFISTLLFAQSFYRYQGTRIDLSLDSNLYVVQPNSQLVEKQNSAFEEKLQKGEIGFFKKIPNNRFLVGGAKLQPENYDYISNVYRDDGNGMVIILPRIAVMFKQEVNLQQVLDKYDGKLIKDGGGNRKYILKCDVSHSEEVLKLVSELDTRDDVIWCEPEFLSDYRANNTLYPQQYYLKNTGQNGGTAGIDINVEPAWNLTNGNSCITVAVIDVGVDRNHEDMGTRVLEGFTIRNATGEGEAQNANSLDSKYHGMACAGIVAASNNTIGIRGVASNVNILPVNIAPDATYIDGLGRRIEGFGTNIEIAEAIGWAWRRADVLSCSWGGGSPSNDITAAIDSARTFGRNGNGTVVVFSSGNNYPGDTDVLYPGRVNGVVTVGAITNQGTICNYSQRGTSMDLVAPSGDANSNNNVTTTDRMGSLGEETSGNYMNDFGGTSAACPQVSGVAALMLLVNPNLTEAQVLTILQQTATDMGTSGFDNTYGHGRVNAYAAVIRAMGGPITGPSVICTSGTTLSITPLAAPDSIIWSCGPNLAISSGQNTTSCNLSITGNGSSWVRARLVSACGSVTLPQKTVWVGTPIVTSVTGASPLGVYQPATYYAELSSFSSMPDSYYWATSPSSGVTITSYGHYASIMFTRSGWYQVVAKAHNACGWSSYAMKMVNVISGYSMAISPNPATGETTVELVNDNKEALATLTEWDYEIYDSMQSLKEKKTKLKAAQTKVNTTSWKAGVYIVRAKIGDEVITEKLIVKH